MFIIFLWVLRLLWVSGIGWLFRIFLRIFLVFWILWLIFTIVIFWFGIISWLVFFMLITMLLIVIWLLLFIRMLLWLILALIIFRIFVISLVNWFDRINRFDLWLIIVDVVNYLSISNCDQVSFVVELNIVAGHEIGTKMNMSRVRHCVFNGNLTF